MTDSRLEKTLSAIDAANGADPRRTPTGVPVEVDHARRLTEWVTRLCPNGSDALRIAARGQHIERWTMARTSYPSGRGGYLRWREEMKAFHARRTGEIMAEAGYGADEISRVTALITKAAHRAGDPEGVALEDGLCLVFLETQYADLAAKTDPAKMADILEKTAQKMSPAGRREMRAVFDKIPRV